LRVRYFAFARRFWNGIALSLAALCAAAVLAPLVLILLYVIKRGAGTLSLAFFTHLPQPVGEPGGGMANAIVGTLELLVIALIAGVPLAIAAGAYVGEFATERFSTAVRFSADVLNGLPTIVTGMFVYLLLVVPMKRFSALAGGVALAVILLPVVIRASEEVLRSVPASYREAALALGATRRQVLWSVVLRSARPGLVMAVLLGIARIAGETAPLLFTSFNNSFWSLRPDQPIASLTVQLFNYAISPYDEWHAQAWAAALVLILIIVVISLVARLWVGRIMGGRQ
jgi:phosphate transport system permease protein